MGPTWVGGRFTELCISEMIKKSSGQLPSCFTSSCQCSSQQSKMAHSMAQKSDVVLILLICATGRGERVQRRH